jgi:alginate O-acetyltransferase complex protein AlgI
MPVSFVSPAFFPFLFAYLAVSALLPQRSWLWFTAAASSLFYAFWDWRFLFLLYYIALVSWFCGLMIHASKNERSRRLYVTISIISSLLMLGVFKYFNFFVDSFGQLLAAAGLAMSPNILRIALPIGISFYTFHALSYTIDIYRRKLKQPTGLLSLVVYLAFFPQLVAGPIVRAWQFLPQIDRGPVFQERKIRLGIALIVWGYFLKVCVANSIAPVADRIFDAPLGYTSGDLLFGIIAYAFQIYGDFAGYSFIAIGVAKLQGFDFPANFLAPYFSRSFSEFWRRWHISLSSFLRDYLYIPLGGNRHGRLKEYRNLFITMFLGGLWHGASYNFAIWGSLHGAYLMGQRAAGDAGIVIAPQRLRWRALRITIQAVQMLAVFALVCLAWMFFRIHTLDSALSYLRQIASGEGLLAVHFKFQVIMATLLIAITIAVDATLIDRRRTVQLLNSRLPLACSLALLLCVIELTGNFGAAGFIYFQF